MTIKPLGPIIGACPAALYGAAVAVRNSLYNSVPSMSREPAIPAISVGGIHAGGTGKTPMTALVARRLMAMGRRVVIVSRGYRRLATEPCVVAPDAVVRWQEVGDEPAMLRAGIPDAWLSVDSDRVAAVTRACVRMPSDGLCVAVLDDAFQHRRIRRRVDIVCIPPNSLNDRLLPSGYLREPPSAVRRATAVCVIGAPGQRDQVLRDCDTFLQHFGCRIVFPMAFVTGPWVRLADGFEADTPDCQRPSAISGVARPERFAQALSGYGIERSNLVSFPDHHAFTEQDLAAVHGGKADAVLTTEKDAIRLRSLKLANHPPIWYLRLGLGFVESMHEPAFDQVLRGATIR